MQSRLAHAARKSSWVLLSSHNDRFTLINGAFCSATRSQTADPAIHSGELEAGPDVHKGQGQGTNNVSRSQTADPAIHSGELEAGPDVHKGVAQGTKNNATNATFAETSSMPSKENNPSDSPKSPTEPSTKLKSTGVNQRLEPNLQQKRNQGTIALENVSCAGLDGTPWPNDKNNEQRIREQQRDDNEGYYGHHTASPLSELEFADSRKPVTRVTDATPRGDVIVFLPEQLDTAEDSLRRATEIWRENAMRGDPDLPHSRRLRELLGEDF